MPLWEKIITSLYFIYRMTFWKFKGKEGRKADYPFLIDEYGDNIAIVEKYLKQHIPLDEEQSRIIKHVNKKGIQSVFPYDFVQNYLFKAMLQLREDRNTHMFYAIRKGRRCYLKQKSFTDALYYYSELIMEQDRKSPHKYCMRYDNGDYLFDCGAAEGFWALDNIDKYSKVVLFEIDSEWVEALKKTFEPYGDKVEIVQKFLTDHSDSECCSIDDYCKTANISSDSKIYIKMDIEGGEVSALHGMDGILTEYSQLELSVCTYHKKNDEKELRRLIENYNRYSIEMSQGYMIMYYGADFAPPYFRKGIMHIEMKR